MVRRLLFLGALMFAVVSRAASPQAMADARELVELLKVDAPLRQIQKMSAMMSELLPPSKGKPVSKGSAELEAIIAELKQRAVEIYATEFSESELVDMLRFFRSPSGSRFLEKQPAIGAQLTRYLTEAPAPRK